MSQTEYKNPLDVAVSKIFGIFHILSESNRFYSSEEPIQLVLLILSMFKDGLIGVKSFNEHDSFDKFEKTLDLISQGHGDPFYNLIVNHLSIGLSKIERQSYNRICKVLSDLDNKYLRENFTEIFDDV